jgi:oligoribonuclease (3'-5' exoribonuclease)
MYSEEEKKIKVKVPFDLWKKVEFLGFDNTDKAVISAFERLVSDSELNIYGKEQEIRINELKNELENEQKHNQELQIEIQRLEKQIENELLQNQQLQNKIKETENGLGDKQKHNQELQIKV